MIGVTAKDLMQEQEERLKKMRQQEEEEKVSVDARYLFRQPPYYMTVNGKDKRTGTYKLEKEGCTEADGDREGGRRDE